MRSCVLWAAELEPPIIIFASIIFVLIFLVSGFSNTVSNWKTLRQANFGQIRLGMTSPKASSIIQTLTVDNGSSTVTKDDTHLDYAL